VDEVDEGDRTFATIQLAIYFSPMAHAVDAHNADFISDFVYHTVIAHADASVVLAAGQLAAAGPARVCSKRLDRGDYAVMDLGRETRKVLLGGALKQDTIHDYLRLRSAK
jgi:hypothetical protein